MPTKITPAVGSLHDQSNRPVDNPLWDDFSPEARPDPALWSACHPYVQELSRRFSELIETAPLASQRTLISYLIGRAEDDGTLPCSGKSVSLRAISLAMGWRQHGLREGSSTVLLLRQLAPYFCLERDRPKSLEDCPTLSMIERVRRYVCRLERDGTGLPRYANTSNISIYGVAHALGVRYADLAVNVQAFGVLREAHSSGRLKLGELFERVHSVSIPERQQILAKLYSTIDSFDTDGAKVPECAKRRGRPDFDYLAELAGEPDHPMVDEAKYVNRVRQVAARRGLTPPAMLERIDNLAALRDHGLQIAEAEQRARDNATGDAAIRNLRSSFNSFLEKLDLTLGDDSSEAFGEAFEANLSRTKATIENSGTARNFARNLRWWASMRDQHIGSLDLPEPLGETLNLLMRRKGIPIGTLASETEILAGTLRSWILGRATPTFPSVPKLRRIEAYFGLTPGTLVNKIGASAHRMINIPTDAAPEYRALSKQERDALPKDAVYWTKMQLGAGLSQVRHLLAGATDHGRLQQLSASEEYLLPFFTPTLRLEKEFEDLLEFKTAPTVYPMDRAPRGRWDKQSTADLRMQPVERMFRFASAPLSEGMNGGLAIDPELATLAWFAHPPLLLANVAFRAKRYADMEWKAERRGTFYTANDRQLIEFGKSLTNPTFGWLTQRPDLAAHLMPIATTVPERYTDLYGFIGGRDGPVLTENHCVEARRDWVAFCTAAHRCYVQAAEYIKDVEQTSRNPFEPIAGFIASPTPMQDILTLLYQAEKQWSDEKTSPTHHRVDVRNAVMLRLAPIHGFRPKNQVGLTYDMRQNGQIRKVSGVWEIEVDYNLFKNHRSCRLFGPKTARRNYKKQLTDHAGLYSLLDQWFFETRNKFPAVEDSPFAFPGNSGGPPTTDSYGQMVRAFSTKHLGWNPLKGTGQPGVSWLNPYSFRHLKATDILKNGQTEFSRVEEAAFGLQTSELMITSHYGFLMPEDIMRRTTDTFDQAAATAYKLAGGN